MCIHSTRERESESLWVGLDRRAQGEDGTRTALSSSGISSPAASTSAWITQGGQCEPPFCRRLAARAPLPARSIATEDAVATSTAVWVIFGGSVWRSPRTHGARITILDSSLLPRRHKQKQADGRGSRDRKRWRKGILTSSPKKMLYRVATLSCCGNQ